VPAGYLQNVCNAFVLGKPCNDGKLVSDGRTIRAYPEFDGGMLIARTKGDDTVEVEQDDDRFSKTVKKQLKDISGVLSGLGKTVIRAPLGELSKGVRMAEHFAAENRKRKTSVKKGAK
jgi:hypothetical protein